MLCPKPPSVLVFEIFKDAHFDLNPPRTFSFHREQSRSMSLKVVVVLLLLLVVVVLVVVRTHSNQ